MYCDKEKGEAVWSDTVASKVKGWTQKETSKEGTNMAFNLRRGNGVHSWV